jgi:hypothetical protein
LANQNTAGPAEKPGRLCFMKYCRLTGSSCSIDEQADSEQPAAHWVDAGLLTPCREAVD